MEVKETNENKAIYKNGKLLKTAPSDHLKDTTSQPMTKVIQENAQSLRVSPFVHFDMQW